MSLPDRVVAAFRDHFGENPTTLVRAPGRVNLIGEHTDYNDGFVLPVALERAVWIALQPRTDSRVRVRSTDYDEWAEFDLTGLASARPPAGSGEASGAESGAGPDAVPGGAGRPEWAEYLVGTAWSLARAGHALQGWEGTMGSDVPIGAGLSSSAALEMVTARALAHVAGIDWDAPAMALLGQKAENQWVGMNCGIMDQMISAVGRAGHAVLIDCRTLELRPVPIPEGTVVIVLDTSTRHKLVDSAYNERRTRCEEAAAQLGVPALRDLTLETLESRIEELDPVTARRARHVVTENDRTEAAAEAMLHGDSERLGVLMNESHISMRDDFEISSPALDAMVESAQEQPGCHGARMTGGGFAGCAVALVDSDAAADFTTAVAAAYTRRTGRDPRIYITAGSAGAAVIDQNTSHEETAQ